MFAYIKLVDEDKYDTIPFSWVKNYDQIKLPVNKNKQHYIMYENQPPKKALLLFVEDNIDALENQINKTRRLAIPAPRNQETASELSDINESSSRKSNNTPDIDINPVVNEQLEQLRAKLATDCEMEPQNSRRINKQYLYKDYNPYQVSRATRSRHKNKIRQLQEKIFLTGVSNSQNIFKSNENSPVTETLVPNTTEFPKSSVDSSSISLALHEHSVEERSTMDFDSSSVDLLCVSKENLMDCSDSNQQKSINNLSSGYFDQCSASHDELFANNDVSDDKLDSDNHDNSDNGPCSDSDSDNSSTSNDSFRFNCDKVNGDTMMFLQSNCTVSDVLLMVTAFSVSKHLTRNDQDELINLIKVLAGPTFESWNASHYSRSKAYNPPRDKMQSNFYCKTDKCHRILHTSKLSDKITKIKGQCTQCKAEYELSSTSENQFIIIDLKYQLKLLFRDIEVKTDLLNTIEKLKRPKNDGVIRDIYDGKLYKTVQKLSPGALTYNVNTDGAPLTKSSKRSMWPIQLHLNELSPALRFRNVILSGLYITSAEPTPEFMQTYMSKFIESANDLMETGINIIDNEGCTRNLKFFCLLFCVDSVARPVIQNRFQFNGYSGCSWCYATGVYDSSAVRYPITQQAPLLRTNQSHLKDVEEVEKVGKTINGVKGSCAMLQLKHFDCVWGFPLDYMHGILLGVTRHLWTLWTKPKTIYYLKPEQRKQIATRQLNIKRPQEIHRLVRTVDHAVKWKASEWESWLLFDSVPCLADILDKKCFQSYLLLVSSIYTLMTDNISEKDLLICEINILQFVRDCQILYGVNSMTFNLHSLLHVVESVRQSGPLWSSSAFPFESMIFLIKRCITGVSGVSNQIINSTLKEKNIRCNIDYNTESVKCRNYCKDLFKPQKLKNYTRSDNHALLIGTEKLPDDQLTQLMHQYFNDIHSVKVFHRCIYNKMVLRSTAYDRPKKTNDTVVLLDTEKFIQIHGFFSLNNTCYLYGNQILTQTSFQSNIQLPHILQVTSMEGETIITRIETIQKKVIFFSTGVNDYIGLFPKNLGT